MRKLKSITEYTAIVGENEAAGEGYKSSYKEYDVNSNLRVDKVYSADEELSSARAFVFDEANQMIEEIHYLSEEEIAERLIYKYEDKELKEVEQIFSDNAKSIRKVTKEGNITKITITNEDGTFEGEEVIEHDERGNAIVETIYDEDRKIMRKYDREFDDKSRLIYLLEVAMDEEFVMEKEFEYNEKGLPIKESNFNEAQDLIGVMVSTYNEDDDLVSQQFDDRYLIKSTYDEKKRRIQDETINLTNNLVEAKMIYKYDENDFIVEKIAYKMGQQFEIEPAVMSRTSSSYISTKIEYEFYDEPA